MFFLVTTGVLWLISIFGNITIYHSFDKHIRKRLLFRTLLGIEVVSTSILPIALVLLVRFAGLETDSKLFIWGIFTSLLFLIPLLFFLIYSLIIVLPFHKFRHYRKVATYVGWGLFLAVFGAILHGGLIGRKKIVAEEDIIYSNRLPASFNNFRIAQISDFHLGSIRHNPEYIKAVIDSVNNQNPDIIFFTGDLVNSRVAEARPFINELSLLKAKYGVYSVLGNHDYAYYHQWPSEEARLKNIDELMELEKNAGWHLLNNAHTIIRKGNDSIVVAGVENWGEKQFGQQGDLTKAMTNVNDSSFTLLLSHNPVHWRHEVIPQTQIDVTFAGHTHAMQFQIGSFSPSKWIYPEWNGLYREGNQYLNVNKGIGFVMLPARIGAYPEISIIELRTQSI